MKKVLYLALVIAILIIVVSSIFINTQEKKDDIEMSTWLWDTALIESHDDVEKMIDFLGKQEVSKLYLQINRSISYQSYRKFISSMNEIGVEVHALDGAPTWDSGDQTALLNWLAMYQETSDETAKFSGVHLDIEFYLHPNWEKQKDELVLNFQSHIRDMIQKLEVLQLPLAVDIPFWFDEIHYDNHFGNDILGKWILQELNSVTIMAYRDEAEGGNGINQLVFNEISWANEFGTKVEIAVETIELPEEHTTFFGKNKVELQEQLAIVRGEYGKEPSFSGFAIHHLVSWMELVGE